MLTISSVARLLFVLALLVPLAGGCEVQDETKTTTDGETETVESAISIGLPAQALIYGQKYNLQNGYAGWAGGYLDTRGAGCEGNKYCVSTAGDFNRDNNSGFWQLKSADGKPEGDPVVAGDRVYLQNGYAGWSGGYLDIRGAGCEGNAYCVSTANSQDRYPGAGTGTWRILPNSGATGELTLGQAVHLQNSYGGWGGGFLDIAGAGCEGNAYCVSTSATWNRDNGSTFWKFEMPMVYGQAYNIQNGYAGWQGGYLDTRGQGCEGNFYCVSTASSPNREYNSGSWKILSADNKPEGAPVVAGDRVFLVNGYAGATAGFKSWRGGWLDIHNGGCEGNAYCASTSVNPNSGPGTGTWKILADNGLGGAMMVGQAVHLQNSYNGWGGGFLDIRGAGCEGNAYCVSTYSGWSRELNTTSWRFFWTGAPRGSAEKAACNPATTGEPCKSQLTSEEVLFKTNCTYGYHVGASWGSGSHKFYDAVDRCAFLHDNGCWTKNKATDVEEAGWACNQTVNFIACVEAVVPQSKEEEDARTCILGSWLKVVANECEPFCFGNRGCMYPLYAGDEVSNSKSICHEGWYPF